MTAINATPRSILHAFQNSTKPIKRGIIFSVSLIYRPRPIRNIDRMYIYIFNARSNDIRYDSWKLEYLRLLEYASCLSRFTATVHVGRVRTKVTEDMEMNERNLIYLGFVGRRKLSAKENHI